MLSAEGGVGLWVSAGFASKMTGFERSFFKLHFARMQSNFCNPPAEVGAGLRMPPWTKPVGTSNGGTSCQRDCLRVAVWPPDGGLTGWVYPLITTGAAFPPGHL